MTRDTLLRTIRQHTGGICVTMHGRDDIFNVRAVKRDLLDVLAHVADNQLEARYAEGWLYIDSYTG